MKVEKFDPTNIKVIKKGTRHPIYDAILALQPGERLTIDWEKDMVKAASIYPNLFTRILSAKDKDNRRNALASIASNIRYQGKNIKLITEDENTFYIYCFKQEVQVRGGGLEGLGGGGRING